MLLEPQRIEVIEYCRKLIHSGLTNGTSGNASIYDASAGLVAISPTGVNYDSLEPQDVAVVDLEGRLVEGLAPSSELAMHLAPYRQREDIQAVLHGHTTYATVLAVMRCDLPAIDYMIAVAGGNNVRCAKYATYGTEELAQNAHEAMKGRRAVILANHGLLTGAQNMKNAYHIMEQVEYISKLYVLAKSTGIAPPVVLDDAEMELMLRKFASYGQAK